MDRISDLPNEIIICHIGSFLSAKEAAFATVLSKRWRNLFTIVPELHYDTWVRNSRSFDVFADRVLAIPVTSRVNRFSIQWSSEDNDYINRCLRHVLKLGVLDLELRIDNKKGYTYTLPFEVFTSETVTKLTLGSNFAIDFLPGDAFLPALKTLCLDSIRFYEFGSFCAFNTLLSASPVLEELNLYPFEECKWSRIVSSPTIKRLTIHNYDSEFESISIDTPALVYLDYANWSPKEYPILNLNSLVEAKLDICKDESILSDPINLINGIKTVEILTLTDGMMELMHDFREAIPMFENLSHLTLMFNKKCCWFGLRVLLEKSPKLKTLIIQDGLHCNVKDGGFEPLCECLLGYSFLSKCRIEVLEIITRLEVDAGEMLHLKLIFENLPCLELLKLRVHGPDEDQEGFASNV